MAEVIIHVARDGKTTVQAEGWTGPTCSTITEPYRRALGKEVAEEKKPEFFADAETFTPLTILPE
jgi:hypothetical protein